MSLCVLSHFCCVWLCAPMDCSPPGSSVQRVLQARILEWVAMSSSRGSSQPRDRTNISLSLLHWQARSLPLEPPGMPPFNEFCSVQSLSHVQLFATPWTGVHQVPLSMGFSRQEHWSGLPCPPPGDLPDSGIETMSLVAPVLLAASSLLNDQGCGFIKHDLCYVYVCVYAIGCKYY